MGSAYNQPWGMNGNQRPEGCFVDDSYPSQVFYNPGGGNYTRNNKCNPAYQSICTNKNAACEGYFCDTKLSTMFLFMTHNSYATDERVWVYNQNFGEGDQFDDGIRGFNFDIYDVDGELLVDHTPNGETMTPSPYLESVQPILNRLDRCQYRNEIVVVEFEMKNSGSQTNQRAIAPWGDKVITNFNSSKPFSYYIDKGQRVLLLTSSSNSNPSIGMHARRTFVTQNEYDWSCNDEYPNFSYREGPQNDSTSAKLMNHFCYNSFNLPDQGDSAMVNDESTIMHNSRMFAKQPQFGSFPNIIMVDFYDKGNIWPAQDSIRKKNLYEGEEWEDGTLCVVRTNCWKCRNEQSFWYSKAMTACGSEPTSESCFADGFRCESGTTCEACCNSYEYWGSLGSTACGKETCSDEGTFCWFDSSCDDCCSDDLDCPWYGFGKACWCG